MEWLKKLGAAIAYIEDNLDKEIKKYEAELNASVLL